MCFAVICSLLHGADVACVRLELDWPFVCCSVLQCVTTRRCCVCDTRIELAVCVSQCVAVCCSVSQCVAVCCSVLQCVAVCRSVLQCVEVCCSVLQCVAVCRSVLQCVAIFCSVLQGADVACVTLELDYLFWCCSVLQWFEVC